ncbi:MAG: 50S ribosomal protein L13 [Planctomycetota bacterium]|nr:50S ribosomal protein L13 [Planctomycetota bacterium]MDA1114638.1 50S ribosomal protein L13 [Planctomycetota bacterium]
MTIAREWHLVDAENQILGHVATQIAMILMGKHKPTHSDHYDCGDNIVLINAQKVAVTGTKAETKTYRRHTGYPGGRREDPYATFLENHPERIIMKAVQRMLPKTKLGRQLIRKLHVYGGAEHPHIAQQPQPLA